jgi:hypothetical protein
MSWHRHSDYVYITDGSGADPYRMLPSYWQAENAAVSWRC